MVWVNVEDTLEQPPTQREINDVATGAASKANLLAMHGMFVQDSLEHNPDEYIEADSIAPHAAEATGLTRRILAKREQLVALRQ